MMTYSNHYNAAVRYMTTIDEALDVIINNMGLVGR
jgi:flagellar hook-associated protein FlgK